MNLLELGTNRGIAGEFHLSTVADVLAIEPFRITWDWCNGCNENSLSITAVLADGNRIILQQSIDAGYADNSIPAYKENADTIGVQIASIDAVGLEFYRLNSNQNGVEESVEYLALTPMDWGKIRRRVEDALRKSEDRAILFDIAQKLNIKLT